ncbi:MAG: hypothetical protein U5K73_09555 [Halofilum sp. (in: g-proteobacteria)]|nr:hypothetical protein [Halofilum sp. (in: g-proteobacteria)]
MQAAGSSSAGPVYPLVLKTFDDEAKGSKALQGAKKLVYQDKVKFINAVGGNPADAVLRS